MSTVMSGQFAIDDGRYGAATEAVREIIANAKSHEWFPRVSLDQQAIGRVRSLIDAHLRMLPDWYAMKSTFDFVSGDWDSLTKLYIECNPPAFANDPAYARGSWRKSLGEIVEQVRRAGLTRQMSRYFIPPLFPVAGNPVILSEMLTADYSKLNTIVDQNEHRQTVWYMMCSVDSDFWDAILWEIVHQGEAKNPFSPLIEAYGLGYYPLGVAGKRFVIFSRS